VLWSQVVGSEPGKVGQDIRYNVNEELVKGHFCKEPSEKQVIKDNFEI
jgi:hypothetical protein